MALKVGNKAVKKVYVGPAEVVKAYVGSDLKYKSGPDPVFGNNDWATIRAVVRSGNIPATWAVGDTKSITLSTGQTIVYRIADKQAGRYTLADGTGSSNMVLEPLTVISGLQAQMNSSDTNIGGFATSRMRSTTLANVLNTFPDDVKNAMSEVLVLSNGGGSPSAAVTSSANKLFLAAETEIAPRDWSSGVEAPKGKFDYYVTHTAQGDRVKSGVSYWLRSPLDNSAYNFIVVAPGGVVAYLSASGNIYVAPFFAI